jgi:hypothetical protein
MIPFQQVLVLAAGFSMATAFSQKFSFFPNPSSSMSLSLANPKQEEHWRDFLKFGGSEPSFDVIARTKEYTSTVAYRKFSLSDINEDSYDQDNYVFRGPVIGPLTRKDLLESNTAFGIQTTFPDLNREAFGFSVDPENPYRVLYFERWKATMKGDLNFRMTTPANGKQSISPIMSFSLVWNPEGRIVYETLSGAIDRFEGTSMGKVAVFGLLQTAGIPLPSTPNPLLAAAQKINRLLNVEGQAYSKDEDIPSWWKSKARGADPNDM